MSSPSKACTPHRWHATIVICFSPGARLPARTFVSIIPPGRKDEREHQKRRDQEEVGKGHHRGALSRTHLVAREGARDPPNDRAYRQEDGGYESNPVQQHSMLAANWPSRTFTLSNTSVDPSEDLLHRGVWILSNSPPERRDHLLLRGPWSGRIARACIRHGVPATVVGAMHLAEQPREALHKAGSRRHAEQHRAVHLHPRWELRKALCDTLCRDHHGDRSLMALIVVWHSSGMPEDGDQLLPEFLK
jgi:hypothetical protein